MFEKKHFAYVITFTFIFSEIRSTNIQPAVDRYQGRWQQVALVNLWTGRLTGSQSCEQIFQNLISKCTQIVHQSLGQECQARADFALLHMASSCSGRGIYWRREEKRIACPQNWKWEDGKWWKQWLQPLIKQTCIVLAGILGSCKELNQEKNAVCLVFNDILII